MLIVSCSTNQDKIFPTEQPLTESVYAIATIQPDSLYQVNAVVSEIIDKVLVEEGDLVFKQLSDEQGLSLLIVTHDEDFAKKTDRIIQMEDGKIIL